MQDDGEAILVVDKTKGESCEHSLGNLEPSQSGIVQTPSCAPETDEGDLQQLEEFFEEENQGLNTRAWLMIILFVAVAAILLVVIIGVFGYLAQGEYGGP